ncbi:hypothetical protein A8F72_35875 [Burkholderia cenocepacia]|nr:hypothetical protein A8F32_17070 [Burkholderia cenocepacia]ONI97769.1 hypothetical protein A8F33_37135 [Burkholderia cenocepacia]ONJ02297.1 hypothetical protein A8F53_20370 [Burkholderia cenocepacia]ONJ34625.1 hypothetical protein A8F38_11365 [Burkholderia cenocepacia]ONY69162.1 hypothetical protein A8F35_23215 [Burkholderia cenocepacia]
MSPLFWLAVCEWRARAPTSAGGARPATSTRDDAAGRPAAAGMVVGTGSVPKRNNDNSFLSKLR